MVAAAAMGFFAAARRVRVAQKLIDIPSRSAACLTSLFSATVRRTLWLMLPDRFLLYLSGRGLDAPRFDFLVAMNP